MSTLDNVKPVVVAVDGSESAKHAARWAAREARLRGLRLRVVHVYQWPLLAYGPVLVDSTGLREVIEDNATTFVHEAVTVAEEAAPGLNPESELHRGPAAAILREVSREAALLVLGSRGLGGFSGLLAGSVTVAMAAHGHCPVVVVREDQPDPNGPVVVGVDGSPAGMSAVALAFEEASVHGCGLVAVHAWTDMVVPITPNGAHYPELDWTGHAERATELVAERLAGWQEQYPDVKVQRVVEYDRPAHALISVAKGAQLLVVGSRGRGGFSGLTLGSVSQAMIHHAPCPVLIARPEATG